MVNESELEEALNLVLDLNNIHTILGKWALEKVTNEDYSAAKLKQELAKIVLASGRK